MLTSLLLWGIFWTMLLRRQNNAKKENRKIWMSIQNINEMFLMTLKKHL